jgi:hypothetical protein
MKTQPAPKVTHDDVLRVIRRDFSHIPESDVLAILNRYGTTEWQRERDRVQLAVLKLAAGDFDALKLHAETACCDYRDVIAPAEYPTYSKHGWSAPFKRGECAKTFEDDWNQYQQWLTRK